MKDHKYLRRSDVLDLLRPMRGTNIWEKITKMPAITGVEMCRECATVPEFKARRCMCCMKRDGDLRAKNHASDRCESDLRGAVRDAGSV